MLVYFIFDMTNWSIFFLASLSAVAFLASVFFMLF